MDMTQYLTAPLQIDKICRACLMQKGDMRPLFGACLDEMLQNFSGIQVIFTYYLTQKVENYSVCLYCAIMT